MNYNLIFSAHPKLTPYLRAYIKKTFGCEGLFNIIAQLRLTCAK
jgi:hypothetical protein